MFRQAAEPRAGYKYQHVFIRLRSRALPEIDGEGLLVQTVLTNSEIDLVNCTLSTLVDAFGQFGFFVTCVQEIPTEGLTTYVLVRAEVAQGMIDNAECRTFRVRSQSK